MLSELLSDTLLPATPLGRARVQCPPRRLCNFATRVAPNQLLNTYFLGDLLVFESLDNNTTKQRGQGGSVSESTQRIISSKFRFKYLDSPNLVNICQHVSVATSSVSDNL